MLCVKWHKSLTVTVSVTPGAEDARRCYIYKSHTAAILTLRFTEHWRIDTVSEVFSKITNTALKIK